MSFETLHLNTIGALMSLQGFINNEIAKHDASGDESAALHWRHYLAKIKFLESDHYSRYEFLREGVSYGRIY